MGGERAFELVLQALHNDEPEAADEAQVQLPAFEASLGTESLQRELLGRSGLRSSDAMVRLRVAEALGRLEGPVDGSALIRRLEHRDGQVPGALLWSLERLAAAGRLAPVEARVLEGLDRLFRSGVADPVRARAIAALVQLDPGSLAAKRARLIKLGGVESTCARLWAGIVAGTSTEAEVAARRDVCEALSHGESAVRAMAIRLFPEMGAVPLDLRCLAERLDSEPRPALRARIVATLQVLTGWKHRERAEAWEHAIKGLPDDWEAPVHDHPSHSGAGGPAVNSASVASLERLAPMSDRVAFLVDFSGSLWNEREDGSCRKDLLDPEMDRLLDQLDPSTLFALIPFTGRPHPFEDESVKADRRQLTRAKRFFKKAKMRGQGNLYDAVQVALSTGDVDRLIILTDGAPTGGVRWNVDLMGDLLVEQTRFRPVIFDFVLLDAPLSLQRAWASVAQRTGGRTLALKM
jgi:HEAT repeat protein